MATANKMLFRVLTHLKAEYRWAVSPRQAKYLVYIEYTRYGFDRTFVEAAVAWTATRLKPRPSGN